LEIICTLFRAAAEWKEDLEAGTKILLEGSLLVVELASLLVIGCGIGVSTRVSTQPLTCLDSQL